METEERVPSLDKLHSDIKPATDPNSKKDEERGGSDDGTISENGNKNEYLRQTDRSDKRRIEESKKFQAKHNSEDSSPEKTEGSPDSSDKASAKKSNVESSTEVISLSFEQDDEEMDDDDADDDDNDHMSNYGTEGDVDSRGVRDDDYLDDEDDVISEDDEPSEMNTSRNNDVAVILGSSDEEDSSQAASQLEAAASRTIDSGANDEYDDMDYEDDCQSDDLMNFALLKSQKSAKTKDKTTQKKISYAAKRRMLSDKSEDTQKYDIRLQLKKRSIKWMKWLRSRSKKMHHVDESNASIDGEAFAPLKSIDSTPTKSKSCQLTDTTIAIEDSPEKLEEDLALKCQQKSQDDMSNINLGDKSVEQMNINTEESPANAVKTKNDDDNKEKANEDQKNNEISHADALKERKGITALEKESKENLHLNDDEKSPKKFGDSEEIIKSENSPPNIMKKGEELKSAPSEEKLSLTDKNECKLENNVEHKESFETNSEPVPESMARNKISTTKRQRSASLNNDSENHPIKKLRAELETTFPMHDRLVDDYIESTPNNTVDDVQKHLNQLIVEIQTINDMIKAKEIEWNNLLHLKKVKEEICFRLTRRKQVLHIMSSKLGEVDFNADNMCDNDKPIDISLQTNKQAKLIASTPNTSVTANNIAPSILNNLNNLNGTSSLNNFNNTMIAGNSNTATATSNNIPAGSSITQTILQNRANMKSSDLAKEKANTQKFHRLLVSRNILPKPSSSAVLGGLAATNTTATTHTTLSIPTFSISSTSATTAATSSIPLQLNNAGSLALLSANSASGVPPILNSYLNAATVQQQLGEIINGHQSAHLNSFQSGNANSNQPLMVGRQGVIKDVRSIIADYRQRHPETVPRRGRRMKGSALGNLTSAEANSILGNALKAEGKLGNSELGILLSKFEGNSRPSSNDSSNSATNITNVNANNNTSANNSVSYKDVLVQFAKMSGQTERLNALGISTKTTTSTTNTTPSTAPAYPEVTLHPVSTSHSVNDQASGSLLHGILTKYNRPSATSTPSAAGNVTQNSLAASYSNTFSPTLARLLTAPERITPTHTGQNLPGVNTSQSGSSSGLNLSKVVGNHSSEITITPVVNPQPYVQTLLQQQIQQQQLKEAAASVAGGKERLKTENLLNTDDEADDSIDRLVIDEGGDSSYGIDEHHRIAPHAIGQEFHENEVPLCQGCKKQEAQFVCAGCGNQWYCSRECQVNAWDEHSEVCTG